VENFGYEGPRIDNQSVLSKSCLTTLNVQLNATGTLTISPQTISQPGITRLCSPRDDIADLLRVQPGTDIWLCPNGAIARLVTANIESPAIPSPEYPSSATNFSRQQQWKLDVVQWLANFGLHIDSIDEEPWVEVEVWEPFFARLAGETWRQSEDAQSTLPLKRMLWPARFCFKRSGPMIRPSCPSHTFDDPLEFAEQWFSEASSLKLNQEPPNIPISAEIPMKDHDMASPQIDSAENLESLSRMAQYPDLQSTNMVYPTPPEGAAIVGTNNPHASEISPDDPDFNLTPGAGQYAKNVSHVEFSPDLQVGTGRYDASDDEDLFGDMNDKDFGAKGITDADFSFFDDPDLETMDEGMPDQEKPTAETPLMPPDQQASVKEEPKEEVREEPPDDGSLEVPQPTDVKEGHLHKMEEPQASPVDESMGLEESTPSPQEPKSQTISPPLSPVEIKKILFPGSEAEDLNQSSDALFQQGHYHPIAFEKKIGDWDQKYGTAGKFWFTTGNASEASDRNSIPTIGMPHRGRGSIATKSTGESAALSSLDNHTRSSSVSSSSDSDLSDEAPLTNAPTPLAMVIPSLKRKRVPSESDIQSVVSLAKSSAVPENGSVSKGDNTTFLGNFLANFSDWTFIGYFSATQIQQVPVLLRREDQVSIAQLLVDQITQSSFDHQLADHVGLSSINSENFPLEACLEGANFLGDLVRLDLKAYTSLQEDPATAQQPPKDSSKGPISKSFPPHVRVRRGKDCLEALPPSISFWETFGLEPAHGKKDVSAYCIHPQAASNAADVFMDRFGLLYQSCNFGNHTRGDQSKAFTNGLRTWGPESSDYSSMMQSLNKICEKLGMSTFIQLKAIADLI
jgi:mediator of RNA polymerase II transcription subunit 13